jgi:phosphate transport system substrate-binding protein
MLPAVQKNKNAIGFISMTWPYDEKTGALTKGVVVLPVDINGDGHIDEEENNCGNIEQIVAAISAGVYPMPPARGLYLVTKGIPKNPIVAEFIKFTITEGQKENLPAGFVEATPEEVEASLGKFK